MRIFVLGTGRCGTHTFKRAASYIENYTSSHNSRTFRRDFPPQYPDNHIAIDVRLASNLGQIGLFYGDDARYVWLRRDPEATAKSWHRFQYDYHASYKPWKYIQGYGVHELGLKMVTIAEQMVACRIYVNTINANIEYFLRDKTDSLQMDLENIREDWGKFWKWSHAVGNYSKSLSTWDKYYFGTIGAKTLQ